MSTVTVARSESAHAPAGPWIQVPHMPGLSAILVLGADIVGLSTTLGVFLGTATIGRFTVPGRWLQWWQLVPISLLLYWFFETYPGVNVSPVDEIRRISLANTSTFLFISVMLALHQAAAISQLICLLGCVAASIAVSRCEPRFAGSGQSSTGGATRWWFLGPERWRSPYCANLKVSPNSDCGQ